VKRPRALAPFRVRQYSLLAGAMSLSLFGGGMWLVAMVWQVIDLHGGPVELSYVATGSAAGMISAVLFGGVAADRIPQRRILIGVECTKVMPVSMALAGPVGEAIGLAPAFLIAGLVPPVLAITAIIDFQMPRDELANPLELPPDELDLADAQGLG
jgi:MFS family permease